MPSAKATPPVAVGTRPPQTSRRSRATYLEQLSARVLRSADKALKDHPKVREDLSSLIGEVILELRRSEESCRELEARLASLSTRHRDLLDRIPVPCVLCDAEGTVASANREALLLLHASERQILSNPIMVWFKDRAEAARLTAELRMLTSPQHREVVLAPRDRRALPCSLVIQPVEGAEPVLFRWFFIAQQ
jgi:PAS domain-containing protein